MNPGVRGSRQRLDLALLRIGLLSTTLVLFAAAYDLWIYSKPPLYQTSLALSLVAWILGAVLAVLALCRPLTMRYAWLILVGLVLAFLAAVYIQYRNAHPLVTPRTDNLMIGEFAVQVLRRGLNPYQWDFSDFRRVYHDLLNFTGFLDGSIQRRLTYPALPTLLLSGLDLAGLGSVKLVSIGAHCMVLVLLFLGSPSTYRPVILLPLFLFREFTSLPLAGLQDVLWCALLLGMILVWDRPIWRAVLFGLACSYRQQPWLIAPFLVLHLWHEGGTTHKRILRAGDFVVISASVFLLLNLPFMIWDPVAWLQGAFEPTFATFNVWSQGIGALTQFGMVSWTRTFYTITQFSFYACCLFIGWRHPRAIGYAIWIIPALFFWLYYRALTNYWLYWIPPLLLLVARSQSVGSLGQRKPSLSTLPGERLVSWKPTALVLTIILTINVLAAVVLALLPAPVAANYKLPLQTTNLLGQEMVRMVEIELTNQSEQSMMPRFSVQREQPYPWLIESGPEVLWPGQVSSYEIRAGFPAVYFPASEGAQIVVSDASGNYAMREVVDIPPEPTLGDPDAVVNPSYAYWSDLGQVPVGWSLSSQPEQTGSVRMETVDGRDSLIMQATESGALSSLRLSQEITFPDAFYIWVYPTSNTASHTLDTGCGLEFYDGVYTTRVYFGGTQYQVKRDGHVVFVTLPAPAITWSRHRVALNEYYQMLDLPLPPMTRRVRNSLSYQTRQVQVSLLFVPGEGADSKAICGAIEQGEDRPVGSNDRLEQALHEPTAYYVGLGNDYRSQGNYGLAKEAYSTALEYDAKNPEAYLGLGEAHFWLAEYVQARAAFLDALARGSQREGDARKGVAWSQYNLDNYEAAVEEFEAAANAYLRRNSPDDKLSLADAYNGLGWAWLQLGACERAVPYFDQALEVVPSLTGALDGRARCTIP